VIINETLIQQLAMQNERIANLYNIGPVQRAEVTQFVEAIVRECANVAMREDHDPAECIKQHFGFE